VSGQSQGGDERIRDTEIISRNQLEKTGENEHGPTYRCPRCGFKFVTEYCDCPECLWAGMCQEGFE
jgi:lipopolysaccharide biosynthesis regulator YciM